MKKDGSTVPRFQTRLFRDGKRPLESLGRLINEESSEAGNPYKLRKVEDLKMGWFYKDLGIVDGIHKWKPRNRCERCSVEYESKNPVSSRYCPDCAPIVNREKNRIRVDRYRKKHRQKKTRKEKKSAD